MLLSISPEKQQKTKNNTNLYYVLYMVLAAPPKTKVSKKQNLTELKNQKKL